jgi:hypothetical protein
VQLDHFVAGRVAARQFDLVPRAIQSLDQQPQDGFVGGGINRRGSHFHAQFIAERIADLIDGGARLDFDRQPQPVWLKRKGKGKRCRSIKR